MHDDGSLTSPPPAQPHRLAHRRRYRRHRDRRHDWRVAHGHQDEHCELIRVVADTGGRAGDRRHQCKLHRRSGGTRALRRTGRCERASFGGASLQPATQEGLYRHFRTIAEAVRTADDPLQRSRPYRRRPRQRHRAAPCRGSNIVGPRTPPASLDRACDLVERAGGVRAVQRRRHDFGRPSDARRPWRHLGDRQRRAARDASRCARPRLRATCAPCAQPMPGSPACIATCSARPTRSRRSGRWRMGLIGDGLRLPSPRCPQPITRARGDAQAGIQA